MKRTGLVLLVMIVAAIGMSVIPAAADCDPFGSCEPAGSGHQLSCGAGTNVGPLATVITRTSTSSAGVQACNDDGPIPPYGRAGVWTNGSSQVVVGVDGDPDNPGSQGWNRADVRTSGGCKVQVRRGSTGSYYNTTPQGSSDEADVFNSQGIACP